MIKRIIVILLVLSCSISYVSAYDAHEHGAAEMQILIEETQIEVIMHIPGSDFIGFEHDNLTEEEEEIIHEKIEALESLGNTLISFRTRRWMKVVLNDLHIEEEGHEEVDHVDGHEEGEHNEFELHFTYSIEESDNLKEMQVSELFRVFPSLTEIRWVKIGLSDQTAGKALVSDSRIGL